MVQCSHLVLTDDIKSFLFPVDCTQSIISVSLRIMVHIKVIPSARPPNHLRINNSSDLHDFTRFFDKSSQLTYTVICIIEFKTLLQSKLTYTLYYIFKRLLKYI